MFLTVTVRDVLHMYFMNPWLSNTLCYEVLRLETSTGLFWHIENTTSLIVQTSKNLRIRSGRQQNASKVRRKSTGLLKVLCRMSAKRVTPTLRFGVPRIIKEPVGFPKSLEEVCRSGGNDEGAAAIPHNGGAAAA